MDRQMVKTTSSVLNGLPTRAWRRPRQNSPLVMSAPWAMCQLSHSMKMTKTAAIMIGKYSRQHAL